MDPNPPQRVADRDEYEQGGGRRRNPRRTAQEIEQRRLVEHCVATLLGQPPAVAGLPCRVAVRQEPHHQVRIGRCQTLPDVRKDHARASGIGVSTLWYPSTLQSTPWPCYPPCSASAGRRGRGGRISCRGSPPPPRLPPPPAVAPPPPP